MIGQDDPFDVSAALAELSRLARNPDVELHQRVDLRLWTALRVGGVADLVVRCRSARAVRQVVDLLASFGVPWLVMGGGSRLVPPDAGLRVPVLLPVGELAGWTYDDCGIVAGAGANLARLGAAMARAGRPLPSQVAELSSTVGGAAAVVLAGDEAGPSRWVEWVDLQRPGRDLLRVGGAPQRPGRADDERSVVVAAALRAGEGAGVPRRERPDSRRGEVWRAVRALDGRSLREALGVSSDWEVAVGECRLTADGDLRLGVRRSASEVRQVVSAARERAGPSWGTLVGTRLRFVDELGRRIAP